MSACSPVLSLLYAMLSAVDGYHCLDSLSLLSRRILSTPSDSDKLVPGIIIQYIPPAEHRANKAERIIQTFKNQIIAGFATANPWSPHGFLGYHTGPALRQYSCYTT